MEISQFIKYTFTTMIACLLISSSFTIIDSSNLEAKPISITSDGSQPSAENVYNEIDTISGWYRYLGTSGHRDAENYIFSKFEGYGLNTSRQEYTADRIDGQVRAVNVIGMLEGIGEPNKWLVIGGHYDANKYSTHGAYDNAAGTGAVIELARFFTEYYQSREGPFISILFGAWDAEEGGGAGSSHFVESLPPEIEVIAYINLDMYSLNYPIHNNIPGAAEEFYKLYLYTSPVQDSSGYNQVDFNETTVENFEIFQDILINISYTMYNYPPEWVVIQDDTEANSDHKFFVRKSIPSVWVRGLHEYPKDEGDLNERNFKHTPADTLETMERYAGGKTELLKGINTGLLISHQLTIEVLNLSSIQAQPIDEMEETEQGGLFSNVGITGYLIAIVVVVVILGGLFFVGKRMKKV